VDLQDRLSTTALKAGGQRSKSFTAHYPDSLLLAFRPAPLTAFNRSIGSSGLRDVTLRAEAGQGVVFVVKGGDQVQQAKNVERKQRAASRAYEPQVTALASKGHTCFNDDAEAGTIYMAQAGEIQQELARAVGDQLFQPGSQQLALTIVDGGPSLKVQNGDIARFTN
jgi:hypothetical protein